jgi:hypothetical protein
MKLTRNMVEDLLQQPDDFQDMVKTDHAEWFAGQKRGRLFDFGTDIWSDADPHLFETEKGLFAVAPSGKVGYVDLDVEVLIAGRHLQVTLIDGTFQVEAV